MSSPSRQSAVADRLHSGAIHLLRRLRALDRAAGLSGPRMSVLSILVFAGPRSLGELAAAEQVRPPTMTRLMQGLEREGLVRRAAAKEDRRRQVFSATAEGKRVLWAGRRRRVESLARAVSRLPASDQAVLDRAAELMETLSAPES